jgi:hypothetical protein
MSVVMTEKDFAEMVYSFLHNKLFDSNTNCHVLKRFMCQDYIKFDILNHKMWDAIRSSFGLDQPDIEGVKRYVLAKKEVSNVQWTEETNKVEQAQVNEGIVECVRLLGGCISVLSTYFKDPTELSKILHAFIDSFNKLEKDFKNENSETRIKLSFTASATDMLRGVKLKGN